jgi:SAM-dependent methyltransferase
MKKLDRLLQHMRVRKVLPLIAPGARVLDIGCADGVLYRNGPRLGRYVGVDPDAPSDGPRDGATFVRGTFPSAALGPEDRFDVITLLAVLEHVPIGAQPAFAGACAAHLVPGGVLAITVPSAAVDRILDVLKALRALDGMETGQHYGFDPATTPAVFLPHGFRLERHETFELGLNHLYVLRRTSGNAEHL